MKKTFKFLLFLAIVAVMGLVLNTALRQYRAPVQPEVEQSTPTATDNKLHVKGLKGSFK